MKKLNDHPSGRILIIAKKDLSQFVMAQHCRRIYKDMPVDQAFTWQEAIDYLNYEEETPAIIFLCLGSIHEVKAFYSALNQVEHIKPESTRIIPFRPFIDPDEIF